MKETTSGAVAGIDTGSVAVAAAHGPPARLRYVLRRAAGPPVVYLHGLGSSKADFMDALDPAGLDGYTVLAFDFPGCGESPEVQPTPSMDQLASLALAAFEELLDRPPVVIGHSMGGLVGLLLAAERPERVRAFVSVEGNLGPEDCFLSRRAVDWLAAGGGDPDGFLGRLMDGQRRSGRSGHAEYAQRAPREVSGRVFVDYSESIVACSDRRPLLDLFLGLEVPAAFVYGAENDGLSCLRRLEEVGATTRVIAHSAHFPQYTHPRGYFAALRELLEGWGKQRDSDPSMRG